MYQIMSRAFGNERLVLDNPILPDVWLEFVRLKGDRADLIITPNDGIPPGPTAVFIRNRLSAETRDRARVVYGRSTISATLALRELVTIVLPLSNWWKTVVLRLARAYLDMSPEDERRRRPMERGPQADPPDWYRLRETYDWLAALPDTVDLATLASRYFLWDLFRFAALLQVANARAQSSEALDQFVESLTNNRPSSVQIREVLQSFGEYVDEIDATMNAMRRGAGPATPEHNVSPALEEGELGAPTRWGAIWSITRNRPATTALSASQRTIKADAASSLFSIRTNDITWAVVDGGIDARHPAFLNMAVNERSAENPLATTRVRATYDFTLLREVLASGSLPAEPAWVARNAERYQQRLAYLRARQDRGDDIDWSIVAPLIEMPHTTELYRPPVIEHGTHVAGILGGCWLAADNPEGTDLIGIARDIRLYDIRVFNDQGESHEDTIVHALQFLAYLNRRRDLPAVHGINLSLSLVHEVKSFACGQTPICVECNRISGAGVVIVAAAGNRGVEAGTGAGAAFEGFRDVSITDPGNADAVITVGATHRSAPHTYGVSYFSSRGPTGDGRRKPDILAPGEKIVAPVPDGGSKALDGTSMAAPHVSGAAALLMARHRELVGQPRRIKEILCRSATDLGREAHFQGAGLVDVLRALQSV
jgi:serine protease AprX